MISPRKSRKHHERYGELSALAIIGQVTPTQYDELETHLKSCAVCRTEYQGLADVLLNQLPVAHQLYESQNLAVDAQPSFDGVAKTRNGWELHAADEFAHDEDSRLGSRSWWTATPQRTVWYAVTVCLSLLVAFLGLKQYEYFRAGQVRNAHVRQLEREVSSLRNDVAEKDRQQTRSDYERSEQQKDKSLEMKAENAELERRNTILDASLEAVKAELQSMKSELLSSRSNEAALSNRIAEAESRAEKAQADLSVALQAHANDAATIRDKEAQLEVIQRELAFLRDDVDRGQQLLAADRDIRDLMGARNLRIIDVSDVDGKGRTRKAFGRVFFTEGKSLIFYAFDLNQDSSQIQSASYQAWGWQGRHMPSARSLGIFYHDDRTPNRWVLKFDNPQVLAEIDSVFVTIEPQGGSKKPTGIRFLSTYIKADLNHP